MQARHETLLDTLTFRQTCVFYAHMLHYLTMTINELHVFRSDIACIASC